MKKIYQFSTWCVLALVALLPAVGAAQTFPSVDDQVYAIFNHGTGKALSISGANDYTNTQQAGCKAHQQTYSGQSSQHWFILRLASGVYRLQNRFSGQTLEIGAASTADWASANQWPYSGGNHQLWNIVAQANGSWVIVNQNSDKLLMPYMSYGDEGQEITQGRQYTIAASTQQWDIYNVSTNSGVYKIINDNSGKVLTAHADDNHVSQWTDSGIGSERWSFSDAGNGAYYITDRNTGKILEIGGGGNTNDAGRYANIWQNNGSVNQKWHLIDSNDQAETPITLREASDGRSCQLKRVNVNMVLEIGGYAYQLNGENQFANQWYNNHTPNQQWHIQYTSLNRSISSPSAKGGQDAETLTRVFAPAFAAKSTLEFYPNPASNELSVWLPGVITLSSVKITDVRGAATTARYLGHGTVDVSSLAPGLYVVSVSDGQREYHQKFVKD